MRKRDVRVYLEDILESAQLTQEFIAGMDLAGFLEDLKTRYAVLRAIQIMGEAVRHIPEKVQQAYPEVPWHQIRGMRNRVTHGYEAVDYELVWSTLCDDIPALIPLIGHILRDLPDDV